MRVYTKTTPTSLLVNIYFFPLSMQTAFATCAVSIHKLAGKLVALIAESVKLQPIIKTKTAN